MDKRSGRASAAAGLLLLSLVAGAAPDAGTLSADERRKLPGSIAFVSERDGHPQVYVLQFGTEGERRLLATPTGDYPAAPAPAGDALLVVSVEERGGQHLEQLSLVSLPQGSAIPIGPRSPRARNPSWSRDGSWLVFESGAASFADLFRVRRDGKELRRLTDNKQGNFEPAISPDGKRIAFVSSRDGDSELYASDADGSHLKRLTAFHRDDWGPRFSPDGKWLAFLSDREGTQRLFLMRPNGTGQRRATSTAAAESEADPAWSPDSRRLAYVARSAEGKSRICVLDVATGAVMPLTGGEHHDGRPAWSPDGRYLAFDSDRGGAPDIYVMRADGNAQTRLTSAPGADWLPRWIPARSR